MAAASTPGTAGLRGPAIVTGVGLGGFFDGIVLHQVFQLHHMLSSTDGDRIGLPTYPVDTVEGLQVNTLWDGLFHVTAYVFVLVGLLLLWRAWQRTDMRRMPVRFLLGGLLAGWGWFNVVEGLIDHQILAIHHVYDGDLRLLWDLLFLAAGIALILVGGWLMRSAGGTARR